jgi:Fe-S-cluster-containing hydrogenase component 2
MGEKGIPKIDYSRCTGCKLCTRECPQGILRGVAREQKGAMALCSNHNPLRPAAAKSCKIA